MIVLPMAGLSRRFLDAGYDRPKYELPLAGRPVFDWALLSFERSFTTQSILIVYRDLPGLTQFLEERCAACGASNVRLVALPEPTRGQAETVALGLDKAGVALDEPLTIFNIDTFRPGLSVEPSATKCHGSLETFVGEGSHWSFVEPVDPGSARVRRVVEKVRISHYCCTGLYSFYDAQTYYQSYEQELANPSSHELFVAPLYQHMINRGLEVNYTVIDKSDVLFCGTPDEYEFLRQNEIAVSGAFDRK
ncbi:dTDP-glucose pyrophosphorylase [Methylobacterium sp. 174MFSha1.1]|uniref:NTP transferase domain-containing protein n=1 Tax=Methylobacterium sp. 174MFSha1.1 TaxID=1502749 RepID=UPI0008EC9024|nr:NTP transferase domain-containing protein [Methylobacterium sp. 174MFSha1.1]SFV15116.1 dTDP-glucose pyrophosphorylase [Methylobacterium sp. 174MFSha1.1]